MLWEQVNIFWGYCEVVPETMRVWNLLEGEKLEVVSVYFPFFFRSLFSPGLICIYLSLHIFIFALTPFYQVSLKFLSYGEKNS